MDDLISRQAAIETINKNRDSVFHDSVHYEDTVYDISNLPSAQKRGRWIEHHEPFTWMGYTYWTCSECGFGEDDNKIRSNFCPNCGADMKGEEK